MPGVLFRNLCWPTLITILGVAILLGLGTREFQQLLVEESEVKTIGEKFAKPIQDLDLLLKYPMDDIFQAEYQRVRISGLFLHEQEMRLMGRRHEGEEGYHMVTPMALPSGSTILVDRGWVPLHGNPVIKRPETPQTIVGFLCVHGQKGDFEPEAPLSNSDLFSIEPAEIAREGNLSTLLPFFVVEEAHPGQQDFPKSEGLTLELGNLHLKYALTWYTLAAALAIFYMLYIRKQIQRSEK